MAQRAHTSRSGSALIEEAVTLLRRTPLSVFLLFYTGAIPFWLGVLYYVNEMHRQARAEEILGEASLAAALLFLWMKWWHAAFARALRATLHGQELRPWGLGQAVQVALGQMAWQPWALVLRPIGWIATLPAVLVSAFFQNLTALADGRPGLGRRAIAQTILWPTQAHVATAKLLLFGFFVWINAAALLVLVPTLLHEFFGIDSMATRNTSAYVLDASFFLASFALTLLCVDPLWKAIWILRCFYGESLATGDDLRISLAAQRRRAQAALTAWLIFIAVLPFQVAAQTAPAPASAAANPAPPRAVSSQELNRSLEEVLSQREYDWRRVAPKAQKKGPLAQWLDSVGKTFKRWAEQAGKWMKKLRDWWEKSIRRKNDKENASAGSLPAKEMTTVLLVVAGAVLIVAVWMIWKGRTRGTIIAQPVQNVPDLEAEDVAADELPEDGWLQMARDLATRGEFRLAMRAAYLSGLAHLGARQLLTIARHKSNREYDRELQRRARSQTELLGAFSQNLRAFESAWYGSHAVDAAGLEHFTANLERIRAS